MSSTKFYIYANKRWCEVDIATGRVAGWRERCKFLYNRHGKLILARNKSVLEGLQALVGGKPTSVRDGLQLSQKRFFKADKRPTKLDHNYHGHSHHECCCNSHKSWKNGKSKYLQISKKRDYITTESHYDDILHNKHGDHGRSFDKSNLKSNNSKSDVEIIQSKSSTDESIGIINTSPKKRKVINHSSSSDIFIKNKTDHLVSPKKMVSLKLGQISKAIKGIVPTVKPIKRGKLNLKYRKHQSSSESELELISLSSDEKVTSVAENSKHKKIKRPQKSDSNGSSTESDDFNSKTTKCSPENNTFLKSDRILRVQKADIKTKSAKLNYESGKIQDGGTTASRVETQKRKVLKRNSKGQFVKSIDNKGKCERNNRSHQAKRKKLKYVTDTFVTTGCSGVSRVREIFMRPFKTSTNGGQKNKEFIISDEDVLLLRDFLNKNAPDFRLDLFDNNEGYKQRILYKINPLVSIERSALIESLLLKKMDENPITLKDFASLLGLRSISEVSLPPHYKMRKRKVNNDTSSETDKENIKNKLKRTSNRTKKDKATEVVTSSSSDEEVLISQQTSRTRGENNITKDQSSRTSMKRPLKEKSSQQQHTMRKRSVTKGASSESDEENLMNRNKAKEQKSIKTKKVKETEPQSSGETSSKKPISNEKNMRQEGSLTTHTISKRPSCTLAREYSNLEDHSIIAWVCSGGRARFVNGNKLWKELQVEYEVLTGQCRTWHSLRNRYLRYILPALGAMALPPATVSRLRAAAATGQEAKSRKQPRRNSIFGSAGQQPRGASSRRPHPHPHPHSPPSSDGDGASIALPSQSTSEPRVFVPRRSPRYSEVTRDFATRHRATTESRDSVGKSRDSFSKSHSTASKGRKLFNPKAAMV